MGVQQKTKQSARWWPTWAARWWPTWAASQAEPEIKNATLESGVREACFRFQHSVHWSLGHFYVPITEPPLEAGNCAK